MANSIPYQKIRSDALQGLRIIAARLTLTLNRRVTYTDAVNILAHGIDDDILDMIVARSKAFQEKTSRMPPC